MLVFQRRPSRRQRDKCLAVREAADMTRRTRPVPGLSPFRWCPRIAVGLAQFSLQRGRPFRRARTPDPIGERLETFALFAKLAQSRCFPQNAQPAFDKALQRQVRLAQRFPDFQDGRVIGQSFGSSHLLEPAAYRARVGVFFLVEHGAQGLQRQSRVAVEYHPPGIDPVRKQRGERFGVAGGIGLELVHTLDEVAEPDEFGAGGVPVTFDHRKADALRGRRPSRDEALSAPTPCKTIADRSPAFLAFRRPPVHPNSVDQGFQRRLAERQQPESPAALRQRLNSRTERRVIDGRFRKLDAVEEQGSARLVQIRPFLAQHPHSLADRVVKVLRSSKNAVKLGDPWVRSDVARPDGESIEPGPQRARLRQASTRRDGHVRQLS